MIFLNSLPVNLKDTKHKDRNEESESNEFVDDLSSLVSGRTEDEQVLNIKSEFKRVQDYLIGHRVKIYS